MSPQAWRSTPDPCWLSPLMPLCLDPTLVEAFSLFTHPVRTSSGVASWTLALIPSLISPPKPVALDTFALRASVSSSVNYGVWDAFSPAKMVLCLGCRLWRVHVGISNWNSHPFLSLEIFYFCRFDVVPITEAGHEKSQPCGPLDKTSVTSVPMWMGEISQGPSPRWRVTGSQYLLREGIFIFLLTK